MTKVREYRQAALVFVLMTLLFFWPLFKGRILSQADMLYSFPPWNSVKPADFASPSNSVLNDQTREFLTFFQVAKESVVHWEFPLWNPYIMAGTPLLANSQSALLFPLNWSFYLLPPYLGFTVSALLKVLIASFGTYLFARQLSISHQGAILAGTTYAFSVFNVFWLNHPHTNATIFFPLLLFMTEQIREKPDLSSMATLALVVGVQFLGGHAEIAFHIAVAVTLFFLFRVISCKSDKPAWWPRLKRLIGGYTLGFFLAGVLMVPFLEFLSQSATWAIRSGKNPFFIEPIGFVSLFLSDLFIPKGWLLDLSAYHAVSLYAGLFPILMAIVILVCQPDRTSVFFACLSLFAFSVVFGLPPVFHLLTSLPLFKQTPNFYMVLFHVLSVSVLGAMGMDLVMATRKDGTIWKKVKRTLITSSVLLPLLVVGLIFVSANTPSFPALKEIQGSSASLWGFVFSQIENNLARNAIFAGCTFLTVIAMVRVPRFKMLFVSLLIGMTFVDLFIAGSGWNPFISVRLARVPVTPATQFLRQDPEIYRIAGMGHVMPPNLATLCGLQDIRGYDVPVALRYHIFFKEALRGKTAWWIYEFPKLDPESLPFLSLLNVKYFLSLDPLPSSLPLVFDREIKVYENPNVFPRAFLVHQVEIVDDEPKALERVMVLGPELRRVAVIEDSHSHFLTGRLMPGEKETTGDRIRIASYTARQVEMNVETSSPGLLILSDTYFPGWKAEVDGEEAAVFRADYLLRAIVVDPGSHRVRFFYHPYSFDVGLGLSAMSGVLILWCLKRKRR